MADVEIRVIVAGWPYWGGGPDVETAKRNFTRYGGRLRGGYEIITLPDGATFEGVDGMGRYHWSGVPADVEPTTVVVPPAGSRRGK